MVDVENGRTPGSNIDKMPVVEEDVEVVTESEMCDKREFQCLPFLAVAVFALHYCAHLMMSAEMNIRVSLHTSILTLEGALYGRDSGGL